MAKKKKEKETLGYSLAAIAEHSPEAMKVTADIIEQSNVVVNDVLERQLEAEVAGHNETRRRLSQANRQLTIIRDRIAWVLGDSFPDETIDEIEEVIKGRPE